MRNEQRLEAVNTFSGGMNLDTDISLLKNNQYRYAEEMRLDSNESSSFGSISPVENHRIVDLSTFSWGDVVATADVRDMSVVFVSGRPTSKIYLVKEDDNGDLDISVIANILYKFPNKISVVTRYEDKDNIKVYWADGIGQIKSLNILSGKSTVSNPDDYNIIQGIGMSAPEVKDILSGDLKYGRYQYFYQLYSENGSSSAISAGSKLVTISDKGVSTISEYGDGLKSNKSIQIKISPENNDYYGVKIYRVYYFRYGASPKIEIIYDSMGDKKVGDFMYVDSGSTTLGDLSIDEFASLSSNYIHPKYIESKDNILFAANAKEDSFDIDYDARSIQFDIDGKAKLYSMDLSTYEEIDRSELNNYDEFKTRLKSLERHDFIHKEIYEKVKYSDLKEVYNASGRFGGSGLNVDFFFENTYLIGAGIGSRALYQSGGYNDPKDKYIDDRIPRIGASNERDIYHMHISSSQSSSIRIEPLTNFGISQHRGKLDYSNGLISAAFAGYKRDEIYRFGVVLHSKSGRSSSVKWIADIRFPANYVSDAVWDAASFEAPENSIKRIDGDLPGLVERRDLLENQELLVKPLGVRFVFRNLPEEVSSLTVVRAKRDVNNRTILAQGALKKVGKMPNFDAFDPSDTGAWRHLVGTSGAIVPDPLMSMGTAATLITLNMRDVASSVAEANRVFKDPDWSNPDGEVLRMNNPHEDPYGRSYSLLGLISPEASFSDGSFGKTIASAGRGLALVFQDIIYPKTTPSVVPGRSDDASSTDGVVIGSREHRYLRDPLDRSNKTTYIYSAADLTENLAMMSTSLEPDDSTFFPMGLATEVHGTTINAVTISPGYGNMHVGPYDASQNSTKYFTESFGRVAVATRNLSYTTLNLTELSNGILKSVANNSDPIALTSSSAKEARFIKAGAGSMSFKYYYNLNSNTGNSGITALNRYSDDNVRWYTRFDITSAGQLPYVELDSAIQADDIDRNVRMSEAPRVFIPGKGPFINHVAMRSTMSYLTTGIGGSNVIATPYGRHGSLVILSAKNPENIPYISHIEKKKRKYTPNRRYQFEANEIHMEPVDRVVSSNLGSYISDIKRMSFGIYGGVGIASRETTEYIYAGFTDRVSGGSVEATVFSGDTYVSMFDYTMVRASDPMLTNYAEDTDADLKLMDLKIYASQQRIGAIIPIETGINTMDNSGKTYIDDSENFMIDKKPGINSIGISSGKSNTITYSQSTNEFAYNSAFSAEPTVRPYFQDLFDTEKNKVFDCRIYASQVKTNDERFDSWTVFKVADYLDVDTQYGEITRLASFNDRLFFWQENAFGVAGTTERALITEGQGHELSLGTGRLLGRYDYISTEIGLDKDTTLGVYVSNNGVYWVNKKNNVIVKFSNALDRISMSKFVQTALNHSSDIVGNTFPIVENRKYSDIMFSFDKLRNVANIK